MGRPVAAALALLALAAVAGCGGNGGVAAGATVDVYVGAGLCSGARQGLSRREGRAGDVEVRVLCLRPAVAPGGKTIDLATQGANARRATEDSTSVAFIEARGKPGEFAKPIVEEAGIAFVEAGSGQAAMGRVLGAIREAGSSGSLRENVREALE